MFVVSHFTLWILSLGVGFSLVRVVGFETAALHLAASFSPRFQHLHRGLCQRRSEAAIGKTGTCLLFDVLDLQAGITGNLPECCVRIASRAGWFWHAFAVVSWDDSSPSAKPRSPES